MGPVEFLAVSFEGNRFTGEIMPELQALRDKGIIRVLDFLFVLKDGDGNTRAVEMENLQAEREALMMDVSDAAPWFSEEDIAKIGDVLEVNSSVAMILFEHAWASRLGEAVRRAGGELLASERVSAAEIERVAEQLRAEGMTAGEKVA